MGIILVSLYPTEGYMVFSELMARQEGQALLQLVVAIIILNQRRILQDFSGGEMQKAPKQVIKVK